MGFLDDETKTRRWEEKGPLTQQAAMTDELRRGGDRQRRLKGSRCQRGGRNETFNGDRKKDEGAEGEEGDSVHRWYSGELMCPVKIQSLGLGR